MDSQLYCASYLPQIWAIEALACSNHVGTTLLLDFLKKTPQICKDIGKNATEWASLKFLESLFIQGVHVSPVSSALRKTVRLDPSDRCEDVLRRVLSEISLSHMKSAGPEILKWDLQPFIEHKKSSLPRCALKQLKSAILTESPSMSSSLKEQSGLAVVSHSEHQSPEKDGHSNGNTPRAEGNTDNGNLLPRNSPDENLVPVIRESRVGESSSEQLYTTCVNPVKKNKHDIIFNEQYAGGQVISSGVHLQITDASTVSLLYIEGKRFGQERRLLTKDDTNECTSSGLLDPNGVLPCEKKVPHFGNGQNNESEKQQRQEQNIEEEGSEYKVCDLKTSNDDVNGFELHMKNVDEVEEKSHVSNDNDGDDDDKTDIARNEKALLNSESETRENGGKGFHGLISTNEDIGKHDQKVPRTVPTVGEAYIDISSDINGYHDEGTVIDAKKKTFLSSQCTFSQDSLATNGWRELHICMKCCDGGNLLSCNADSCPIVIHKSCLGSDVSFDTRETFYCPFCAYSRAISKYEEVKKHAFVARKNFATLICLEPQNESNKQPCRSFRMDGNLLKENDGLPKSNELNQINVVEVSNNKKRKKLEYEQAGPSKLRSDSSPPLGRKAADSTDRLVHNSKGHKQDEKGIRKESRRLRGSRWKPIAAEAVHNTLSETVVSETSGSENHADVRSKKGVPHPAETNLPSKGKCSQSSQSNDAEELSEEENGHSGASKYRLRVQKQERQNLCLESPQLRRKRLPWTSEEEDKLKEGMRKYCGPHTIKIPWIDILRHGEGTYHPSRTTVDLKDKWRNMCKAKPKSK